MGLPWLAVTLRTMKMRKAMDFSWVRGYERSVRKHLRIAAICLLLLPAAGAAKAATRSYFLVVSQGVDLVDAAARLANEGVRVRQRVPPRVMVVDAPATKDLSRLVSIESMTTGAVALDALAQLGPLSVAAGKHWNRRVLAAAGQAGGLQAGAVRAMVSRNSLAAPSGLRASAFHGGASVTWDGIAGAVYYDVEAARDASFSDVLYRSRTARTDLRMPADAPFLYVRVRGVDHADGTHERNADVFGPWSAAYGLAASTFSTDDPAPAPQLSSPRSGLETQGFTAVLEWVAASNADYRVQAAGDRGFAQTLFDEIVSGGEAALPGGSLHTGDRFFWRVKRWADGGGAWSEARELEIGEPRHETGDVFVNPEAPR